MNEEVVNKARLEYEAGVNRPSFDAAESEVKARVARTDAIASKQTTSTAPQEKSAQASTRAAEAAKRHAAAEDAVFQSLVKSERQAQEVAVSMTRLGNAPVGERLARQMQIAERQLAITRRDAQSLLRLMEAPTDARMLKAIDREAQLAARRVTDLEARLKGLRSQADGTALDGGGPAGGGLGGPGAQAAGSGAGSGGGLGGGLRGQRALLRAGVRAVGLPSELGSLGGLELYGGAIAGIGAGLAVLAGVREIIKLSNEAEEAQLNLAVAARGTGRSFGEQRAVFDEVREEMHANYEEAVALAKGFGELQLKSGEAIKPGDVRAFTNLAESSGLKPDEAAKAFSELAKGSKEAFSSLTGQTEAQATLLLDNYARSIGTTTSKLTEMEKVEVLAGEARKIGNDRSAEAARRMDTFSEKTKGAFERLKDFSVEYGRAFYHGVILNESADDAYKREVAEFDRQAAEDNRRAIEGNKAKAAQAEIDRQQKLARSLDQRLDEQDRAQRAKPENYQAGQSQLERRQQDLAELRANRATAQAELDAFAATKAQYAPDDADRFEKQLQDRVQGFTDSIRGQVDSMASDVKSKVESLRKDVLNSTAEFSQLRLIDDRANPYVKLFADAEEAARKAQERFGLVGDAAVREFLKAQNAMRDAQLWELRVKDSMSAVKLEFEAAQLEKPFHELTGEMKRTISIFETEVRAATTAPGLQAQAEQVRLRQQYRFGFNSNPDELRRRGFYFDRQGAQVDNDVIARQQFDRLEGLERKYGATPGLGGEQIRDELAKQFTKLYESLSPRAREEIARNPALSRRFAGAYDEQAQFQEREIGRAAERAEAQRATVRLAEAQLRELNNLRGQRGATDAGTRAEFLRITGELPREELTPGLARGRVAALKEEAQFQRAREKAADDATKATLQFQERLIGKDGKSGALGQIVAAINSRQDKVLVEVLDRTDTAKTSTLGQGFAPSSTAGAGDSSLPSGFPGFAPGFRE